MDRATACKWMKEIWPNSTLEELRGGTYDRFAEFINGKLTASMATKTEFGPSIITIVRELGTILPDDFTRQNAYATVHKITSTRPNSQLVCARSLDLALSIMVTLDIRTEPSDDPRHASIHPGPSIWEENMSLSEAVTVHFSQMSSSSFDIKLGRIDPGLTAAYLSSHRGFTICWTSNLSEHLTINWKSRVLSIYEHKICLWNHLNSPGSPILPRGVLEEAIDTLNLLFPLNDIPTKVFLEQNGRPFYGLGYCKRERCYELARFQIWRGRLADLIDVMNEEPKGIQQLALSQDGKNLLSFATFWIAFAVAFLTIISIAFGTVQTIYSIKQYNLAVAQACSIPRAVSTLPKYCK